MHYRVKQKKQVSKWQVCQGYHLCKGTKKDLDARVHLCTATEKRLEGHDPRRPKVGYCLSLYHHVKFLAVLPST